MPIVRVTLLLVGWSLVGFARAEYVLPEGVSCRDPDAESIDMNCQFVFEEQADSELNKVYKALIGSLGKEEAALLQRSQRAWLAFRNAEVALVVQHYGEGGALGRSIGARRSSQLTRARVAELRQRLDPESQW